MKLDKIQKIFPVLSGREIYSIIKYTSPFMNCKCCVCEYRKESGYLFYIRNIGTQWGDKRTEFICESCYKKGKK